MLTKRTYDTMHMAAGSGRSASSDVLPVSRSTLDDRTGEHTAAGGRLKKQNAQERVTATKKRHGICHVSFRKRCDYLLKRFLVSSYSAV